MPATTRTLARYLTHLAQLGRKASTIRRARVAVGVIHGQQGLPRPDHDERIRTLERGIGRTHGTREEGAPPLLLADLTKMVASLGDTAREDRDRALLLLGFAGAYRASDLCHLNIEHVTLRPNAMVVLLPRSKEDALGQGELTEIPIATNAGLCPVRAVRTWLSRVGRLQGPLFRLAFGNSIEPIGIHPRAVSRAVQRAAARAGLKGDYSAHSLRSGLATSAYAQGATEREIQAHGRWKDRRSLDRYIHMDQVAGRPNVAASVFR